MIANNLTKTELPIRSLEKERAILLVDDRPENLLTLESVLNNGKRRFIKAESGNEALKIALQEPISLILMDIQMPEMDGIETSQLLRLNPRTRHIPILFVSAINPKERHPLEGFEPGTVDFLFKPLNLEETRTRVAHFEKLWDFRQEAMKRTAMHEKLSKEFDRFVYMVSHDLKAPLRAITNLASWIGEDLGNTAQANVMENLGLLQERVTRLNHMIDGILEYSRTDRIQESPVQTDLKKLVAGIFEGLQPSSSFSIEFTGNWPVVLTEKTKLEKVFRQLLRNSLIHHDKTEGVVKAGIEQKGNWLQFQVSDDGPGIKPVHYKTIFEMFQTLQSRDEKNHAGAGLAVARKIIEDLGGSITAGACEPRGTVFTFTWPC